MNTLTAPSSFRYLSKWLLLLTVAWAVIYFSVFPEPLALLSSNWPLILVGFCGAIIGNMTAIGGGIVFIPVLMFVYKTDPVSALKLAFVCQAVGMTSGATGWIQRKEVPLKLLKWTIPSLLLGTIVSTFVFHPSPLIVKTLFGPISLLVGILTLITMHRKGTLTTLPEKAMVPVFIISFIGGIITGWVAIGEGEIIAAFCMLVYGLSANKSIGLGVVLLAVNSIVLALVHALYFGGVPWEMAIFTILGCLWGGRMGPYLSQRVSGFNVKRVFAWVALLDGLLIIFQVSRIYLSK
ncbi:MAG TPA: sulfite exporter TauE/SafE family protein [Bacteroidia bacterium]|nr:sulfite exporter TauE/SafE family protein [Bacteroidia bacterium]